MADCAHAGLTQIPKSLPKDTDWLILTGNNISSLHIEDLKLFAILTTLDLKYNKIKSISEDVLEYFSTFSNMINLDISFNELETVPINFKNAKFLNKLSLSGNRFQCKCENMWMRNWLIDRRQIVADFNEVECEMESEEKIKFLQLTETDLICASMGTPYFI